MLNFHKIRLINTKQNTVAMPLTKQYCLKHSTFVFKVLNVHTFNLFKLHFTCIYKKYTVKKIRCCKYNQLKLLKLLT